MTPYRPPVYVANPMINQGIILPDPNPAIGMVQVYPTYTYPTIPVMQQQPEAIIPTIQVQAPPTTIMKERYLPPPPPPPVHCHSSPRVQTTVSTPSTIINRITNPAPIVQTPPMRDIHIKRTKKIKFPQSNVISVTTTPQPTSKPAMKTVTTINRTTRRTTTKGSGRH
ncbi:hypothetical protein I302_107580 [Kwoniella bestiolae CBS 10118]|uniref:Uncharacterized protein n=1 Tax=Kwoniella bestiolae CBS 10118 TaxID=1296100 RepID=A0A1B9FY47_9TREE|nr:hypothetical protein I302_06680 [Kwoniella bestiolae CBS 10118]OCF23697.1 hypothetical protein I302_06680 [Kwoniella bestiolae CBS 10118]